MCFEIAFKEIIDIEGEQYTNDPLDRGGGTKFGITEAVARKHGYDGDMKDLSRGFAKKVYKIDYWDVYRSDQIAVYSPDIALELFEFGVNCGTKTAAKAFQESLGCLKLKTNQNDLMVDGIVGRKTIYRFKSMLDSHYLAEQTILKMINVIQGKKYMDIVKRDPSQKRFILGWFKRVSL